MTDYHDGIDRDESQDPTVHRDLVVLDPPMWGRDVANMQRAVQARLDARGIDVPTPTHGKFTHATAVAGVEAGYFIGLLSDTYLKTMKVDGEPRLVATEGAQTYVRNPDSRSPEQLARAKDRQGQLERGPRYYDDLAKEQGISGGKGVEAALAFARKYIGTTESPAGSNWGHPVQDWIKLAGYNSPVPWCGAACNAFCMAGSIPSGAGWIGYTPAIIAHAKAGTGGWSWHSTYMGIPGDLALMDTPGGDPSVHVGMVEKKINNNSYQTIEGNTSSGSGGSQDHGGGVFRRIRSTGGSFYIVGFARPPW
jgi:hypothetical protein